MSDNDFEIELDELRKFIKKYKKATGTTAQIKLGMSVRRALDKTNLSEEKKNRLRRIIRLLQDSVTPQDDERLDGPTELTKTLSKSLQDAIRRSEMSGVEYVNYYINGGKKNKLIDRTSKEDETRPASRPMSSKVNEVRPATKPKSTKVDEVRPATKPKKPLGKNIREKVNKIERPKPKPKAKPKAKQPTGKKTYDRPPAYCFTKKPADRDPYVVCVPSFV